MPEGSGEVGHVLTEKVGPLPLVLWVATGASVIFVVMLLKNKGSSGAQGVQTNQVSALAPTEAEAFGTIEQQQQDVTNALTTLGNNQSALGGSMSTLTGIVTQQGADNAASFQNLLNGQSTIEQGQASAASLSSNYYASILTNLQNYYNSLTGQLNGVNSNLQTHIDTGTAALQAGNAQTQGLLQQVQASLAALTGQVNAQGQQQALTAAQQQQLNTANMYIGYANATALTAGPNDPRVVQWLQLAQQVASGAIPH